MWVNTLLNHHLIEVKMKSNNPNIYFNNSNELSPAKAHYERMQRDNLRMALHIIKERYWDDAKIRLDALKYPTDMRETLVTSVPKYAKSLFNIGRDYFTNVDSSVRGRCPSAFISYAWDKSSIWDGDNCYGEDISGFGKLLRETLFEDLRTLGFEPQIDIENISAAMPINEFEKDIRSRTYIFVICTSKYNFRYIDDLSSKAKAKIQSGVSESANLDRNRAGVAYEMEYIESRLKKTMQTVENRLSVSRLKPTIIPLRFQGSFDEAVPLSLRGVKVLDCTTKDNYRLAMFDVVKSLYAINGELTEHMSEYKIFLQNDVMDIYDRLRFGEGPISILKTGRSLYPVFSGVSRSVSRQIIQAALDLDREKKFLTNPPDSKNFKQQKEQIPPISDKAALLIEKAKKKGPDYLKNKEIETIFDEISCCLLEKAKFNTFSTKREITKDMKDQFKGRIESNIEKYTEKGLFDALNAICFLIQDFQYITIFNLYCLDRAIKNNKDMTFATNEEIISSITSNDLRTIQTLPAVQFTNIFGLEVKEQERYIKESCLPIYFAYVKSQIQSKLDNRKKHEKDMRRWCEEKQYLIDCSQSVENIKLDGIFQHSNDGIATYSGHEDATTNSMASPPPPYHYRDEIEKTTVSEPTEEQDGRIQPELKQGLLSQSPKMFPVHRNMNPHETERRYSLPASDSSTPPKTPPRPRVLGTSATTTSFSLDSSMDLGSNNEDNASGGFSAPRQDGKIQLELKRRLLSQSPKTSPVSRNINPHETERRYSLSEDSSIPPKTPPRPRVLGSSAITASSSLDLSADLCFNNEGSALVSAPVERCSTSSVLNTGIFGKSTRSESTTKLSYTSGSKI